MRLRRRNAPSSPRSLQRSASAKSIRFSLAENCRRVAISNHLGVWALIYDGYMIEDLEMTDSIEEAGERVFTEDFDTWGITGYYLYSKLLRSGVSRHIGTGGPRKCRIAHEQPVVDAEGHLRPRNHPFAAHPKAPVRSATIP